MVAFHFIQLYQKSASIRLILDRHADERGGIAGEGVLCRDIALEFEKQKRHLAWRGGAFALAQEPTRISGLRRRGCRRGS